VALVGVGGDEDAWGDLELWVDCSFRDLGRLSKVGNFERIFLIQQYILHLYPIMHNIIPMHKLHRLHNHPKICPQQFLLHPIGILHKMEHRPIGNILHNDHLTNGFMAFGSMHSLLSVLVVLSDMRMVEFGAEVEFVLGG
jgi:hypothetical protein